MNDDARSHTHLASPGRSARLPPILSSKILFALAAASRTWSIWSANCTSKASSSRASPIPLTSGHHPAGSSFTSWPAWPRWSRSWQSNAPASPDGERQWLKRFYGERGGAGLTPEAGGAKRAAGIAGAVHRGEPAVVSLVGVQGGQRGARTGDARHRRQHCRPRWAVACSILTLASRRLMRGALLPAPPSQYIILNYSLSWNIIYSYKSLARNQPL